MAFHGIRNQLRDRFFALWKQTLRTDDGKQAVVEPLQGLLGGYPSALQSAAKNRPPYAELGTADHHGRTSMRDDIIIITARFRSGSTLLWNLFRQTPGCTSYYEPFNERRWFDPQTRGGKVDATHLEVDEYWREYEGLQELGDYYQLDWIDRHLLMDEHFHAPLMKRYVELLIERAPGRPVLQFNRIDFRLPWFRHNFPHARIVHIYRHPRDQWCSTLLDDTGCDRSRRFADFEPHDKFYLGTWVKDLKYHFPFLADVGDSHPYRAFYLIWKLSWLNGTVFADHSLAFEQLVENPAVELQRLFQAVQLSAQPEQLLSVIKKPALGKWQRYADDAWFREHEAAAETMLADFWGIR